MSESSDLKRGAEALKTFKKRVDAILDAFEGSPGGAKHVAQQDVPHSAFKGVGAFPEADGLFSAYQGVHERLTTLSKSLGLQIEAMGIAVHGADIGFDNLEDELLLRFHSLQTQIEQNNEKPGQSKDEGPKDTKVKY